MTPPGSFVCPEDHPRRSSPTRAGLTSSRYRSPEPLWTIIHQAPGRPPARRRAALRVPPTGSPPAQARATRAGEKQKRKPTPADGDPARSPLSASLDEAAGPEPAEVQDLTIGVGPTTTPVAPKRRPVSKEVAVYDYVDKDGKLHYQVVRLDPKVFLQRRPDPDRPGLWINNMKGVERIPYRLDLLAASPGEGLVFVVEGEKDADRLNSMNLLATTNPGGAGEVAGRVRRPSPGQGRRDRAGQ